MKSHFISMNMGREFPWSSSMGKGDKWVMDPMCPYYVLDDFKHYLPRLPTWPPVAPYSLRNCPLKKRWY